MGARALAPFQSTHPRGVRRVGCGCAVAPSPGFNPRTHAGCDLRPVGLRLGGDVSIHAPTRGATAAVVAGVGGSVVSIHAPTRGATPSRCRCRRERRFNPRTHAGCDAESSSGIADVAVSIHAPTRGATAMVRTYGESGLFQSTHPRGVRHDARDGFAHFGRFQSTHPRGVRHSPSACFRILNSVSIHAPTRGATVPDSSEHVGVGVSIHAPTRGATGSLSIHRSKAMFQSTHPRGVRLLRRGQCAVAGDVSIHAPTRGATSPNLANSVLPSVSIHAPTRGATLIVCN